MTAISTPDIALRSVAATASAPAGDRGAALAVAFKIARTTMAFALSVAVVLGLWQALVGGLDLNPLVAKRPLDVWRYLVTDASASTNRTTIFSALRTTLGEAAIGYVFGTVIAIATAVVFVMKRSVSQAVMPVCMVLQSVPLNAMTPVLCVVFGRGILGTTVICGIVTFFPTLVNMVVAMRGVPPQTSDLITAYGAGPFTRLRKVQLPSAMPALFASARISVPLALVGALLAEWLATGKGIGYLMLQTKSTFAYNALWSAVVVTTFATVVLYAIITIIEAPVLARFAPDRVGAR